MSETIFGFIVSGSRFKFFYKEHSKKLKTIKIIYLYSSLELHEGLFISRRSLQPKSCSSKCEYLILSYFPDHQCCGYGMLIPDRDFYPIPDSGSKNSNKREG